MNAAEFGWENGIRNGNKKRAVSRVSYVVRLPCCSWRDFAVSDIPPVAAPVQDEIFKNMGLTNPGELRPDGMR